MTTTLSIAQNSVTTAPFHVEDFLEVVTANLREHQDVQDLLAGGIRFEGCRTSPEVKWEEVAASVVRWHTTNVELSTPRRLFALSFDAHLTVPCTWSKRSTAMRRSTGDSKYSFAKRMRQLAALDEFERPSTVAYDLASQLDSLASEVSRSQDAAVPPTVVSFVEGGELLVEWNFRGAAVRHMECLIPRSGYGPYRLLISRENKLGKVLKFTEIPEASYVEMLDHVNKFLSNNGEIA